MISTVITELETIANAFASVESFIYNRVSAVNWQNRDKQYPCILVDSNPDIDLQEPNKSFLPRKKNYTIRIFLFDEFGVEEQKNKTLPEKQTELEQILDQYLAEIHRRCIADPTIGFMIDGYETAGGFIAFPVHNDKLMQVVYTVRIVANSECELGTFTYD